jgi:hypothetical protein
MSTTACDVDRFYAVVPIKIFECFSNFCDPMFKKGVKRISFFLFYFYEFTTNFILFPILKSVYCQTQSAPGFNTLNWGMCATLKVVVHVLKIGLFIGYCRRANPIHPVQRACTVLRVNQNTGIFETWQQHVHGRLAIWHIRFFPH